METCCHIRSTRVETCYSDGSVTNSASAKNITISKKVSGNMGDTGKEFSFSVTLSGLTQEIAYTKTDTAGQTTSHTATPQEGTITLTLKHDESVTLKDIPSGLAYTIAESKVSAEGYVTSYSINDADAVEGRSVSGTLSDDLVIAFTNTKDVVIPSGVNTHSAVWPILALIPCLLGFLVWTNRRRGRYEK